MPLGSSKRVDALLSFLDQNSIPREKRALFDFQGNLDLTNGLMLAVHHLFSSNGERRSVLLRCLGHEELMSKNACMDLRSLSIKMDRIRAAEKRETRKGRTSIFYSEVLDKRNFNLTLPDLLPVVTSSSRNDSVDKLAEKVQSHWEEKFRIISKRHNSKIKSLRRVVSRSSTKIDEYKSSLSSKYRVLRAKLRSMQRTMSILRCSANQLEITNNVSLSRLKQKANVCRLLVEQNKHLESQLSIAENKVKSSLGDKFFSIDEKGHYLPEVNNCILSLIDLNIADKSVGPVMQVVAKLLGKTISNLPSERTVGRMGMASLSLARSHVGAVLECITERGLNTCLLSDETTKNSHKLQSMGFTYMNENGLISRRQYIY